MTLDSMPIADPYHPQVWQVAEVLLDDVGILIRLLLAWYPPLLGLDGIVADDLVSLQLLRHGHVGFSYKALVYMSRIPNYVS